MTEQDIKLYLQLNKQYDPYRQYPTASAHF